MASLQDIQSAWQSKQGFDIGKNYKGASQVGFVGDSATLAGQKFSSPQELYNTVYGGGSGSSSSSLSAGNYTMPDFDETLKRAIELQTQAVKPAISSLQASIPEIGQKFETQRQQLEAQKDPLKARYDALISDINRRQGVAETTATRTTSQELGRRGIVGSSGIADVALQEAVQPIRSEYGALATQAGLGREEGLMALQNQITNLTPLEVEAKRAVQNAIAQLQSATTQSAVNTALEQLKIAQDNVALAQAQKQADWDQQFRQEAFDYQKEQDALNRQKASSESSWIDKLLAQQAEQAKRQQGLEDLLATFNTTANASGGNTNLYGAGGGGGGGGGGAG
jgi:hypothetical protein